MAPEPTAPRSPAALAGIPWPHRLGTRIFVATIVVAVGVLAALAITDAKMSQQIVEQAIRSNALLAETIQATTRSAMLLGIPSHAYRSMDGVGRIPGVLRMRVVDKDGRIVISSKTDEIGTVFPKGAPSRPSAPSTANGSAPRRAATAIPPAGPSWGSSRSRSP
jgi:hypothetical protein